jgi:hypothetical protein
LLGVLGHCRRTGCERLERRLITFVSSVYVAGWASLGLGAAQPLTPPVDTLSGHSADQILAVEPLVVQEAALDVPIKPLDRLEKGGGDGTRGGILEAVQGMAMSATARAASDNVLGAVDALVSAAMLPTADSQIVRPTEAMKGDAALVGSPPERSLITPSHR